MVMFKPAEILSLSIMSLLGQKNYICSQLETCWRGTYSPLTLFQLSETSESSLRITATLKHLRASLLYFTRSAKLLNYGNVIAFFVYISRSVSLYQLDLKFAHANSPTMSPVFKPNACVERKYLSILFSTKCLEFQ